MTEAFFHYTNKIVRLSPSEQQAIKEALTHRKVPAKTELASNGKATDELFFLIEGCIRKYYVKDGDQITIYITTEQNFIGDIGGFINGAKSSETIECLEECEVLVLKKKDLDMLYSTVAPMNELIRKILEPTLIQLQQALNSFILDKPEERYLKLLSKNPEILQRVPQHMLATYLGITPTSLGRIRKRILEKE